MNPLRSHWFMRSAEKSNIPNLKGERFRRRHRTATDDRFVPGACQLCGRAVLPGDVDSTEIEAEAISALALAAIGVSHEDMVARLRRPFMRPHCEQATTAIFAIAHEH
jgi:hypothetical protein